MNVLISSIYNKFEQISKKKTDISIEECIKGWADISQKKKIQLAKKQEKVPNLISNDTNAY